MEKPFKACWDAHKIDGIIPQEKDTQYNGRSCECGKLLFYLEGCGCPGAAQPYVLKAKENPDYIPA